MAQLIVVTLRPRRVVVRGHRVHHGLGGLAIAALGLAVALSDWSDRRVWFPDFFSHGP